SWLQEEDRRIAHLIARRGGERAWRVRDALGEALSQELGIVRTRESMARALEGIQALRVRAEQVSLDDRGRVFNTDLIQALELTSLVELAETIVAGALAREESRGAHYRSDYPKRDDAHWLVH